METNATPFAPADEQLAAGDPLPEAEAQAQVDPFEIASLTLPSGARVEFRSLATVTNENVRWLRKAMDNDGNGSFLNDLMSRGMQLLITSWDATDLNGRPLRLPRDDAKAVDKLSAVDGRAIERHLKRPLERLVLGDEDGEQGK